jgi:hypothetical protein
MGIGNPEIKTYTATGTRTNTINKLFALIALTEIFIYTFGPV